VGALCSGWLAFPTFPQWLGKNSTTGKQRRLTTELVTHTSLQVGQGFNAVRMEYVPYLRRRLLTELSAAGEEGSSGGGGAQKCIALLDSYGLSRDDFMENLRELQFISPEPRPGSMDLKDAYEGLDSKVKAAFTRLYNTTVHASQALVAAQAMSGKSRKKAGGGGDEDAEGGTTEDLEAARAVDDEEGQEEEIDLKAFAAAVKKKDAGKGKGKAKK
jgi:replication factor C subunit 1